MVQDMQLDQAKVLVGVTVEFVRVCHYLALVFLQDGADDQLLPTILRPKVNAALHVHGHGDIAGQLGRAVPVKHLDTRRLEIPLHIETGGFIEPLAPGSGSVDQQRCGDQFAVTKLNAGDPAAQLPYTTYF
jgi:hypothetical protein